MRTVAVSMAGVVLSAVAVAVTGSFAVLFGVAGVAAAAVL